jgi:hypothetical protein
MHNWENSFSHCNFESGYSPNDGRKFTNKTMPKFPEICPASKEWRRFVELHGKH